MRFLPASLLICFAWLKYDGSFAPVRDANLFASFHRRSQNSNFVINSRAIIVNVVQNPLSGPGSTNSRFDQIEHVHDIGDG
jgi:hypothetical protein